jgi:hypothetical protein
MVYTDTDECDILPIEHLSMPIHRIRNSMPDGSERVRQWFVRLIRIRKLPPAVCIQAGVRIAVRVVFVVHVETYGIKTEFFKSCCNLSARDA